MFWGVSIVSGHRYSQTVANTYHISKAVLELPADGKTSPKRIQVMVEHEKTEYVLCALDSEKNYQVDLDLIFSAGESVTFYLKGEGTIHLTGYLMDFDDEDDDDESDIEFETLASKRKLDTSTESPKKKQLKVDNKGGDALLNGGDDSEDDEEDDDFDEDDLGDLDMDDLDDEDDEELDDEEDDEESDDKEVAISPPKKQLNGQVKNQQNVGANKNLQNQKFNQKGGNQNQNKFGEKPKNQQSPNNKPFNQQQNKFANQKGGQSTPKFQNQKNQGQQNKQGGGGQFNQQNKQNRSFTPHPKASNKFNKNKKRSSMA